MAELDAIIQPEEYWNAEVPAWAFLPNLRLLLGWGEGLWETLGDRMSAVRTLFVMAQDRPHAPEDMQDFFDWLDRYDADRPPMPFYARALDGSRCRTLRANVICERYAGTPVHAACGAECLHPLEANQEYRIVPFEWPSGMISIVVEKRAKTLKPEFQAAMAEFGLAHARGTGRRADRKPADQKRVRRRRNESEQGFAEYLDDLKREYRERRVPELLTEPDARPPRFLVQMAELARSRLEAVARGKNDDDGAPYRPYETDELLLATCHSIASAESTELAFDYAWKPVYRFDQHGPAAL